ncbi:MAG: cytochrome c3 family protein [Deltaproteobacteria bacterium]|nr:cytochrome c3 family protein [Deltaproteobacteria bacterium]
MPHTKYRHTLAFLLLAGTALLSAASPVRAEGKFKLQPGAHGKICLTCHVEFSEKMKKKFIHTPLTQGECSGCHNPHTSSHAKLMAAGTDSICYQCHDQLVPDQARSAHKVVQEGKCVSCHDPHSSDNPANLLEAGKKLCFGCHKELAARIEKNKFKHAPVEKDCLGCHTPHASADNDQLLKTDVKSLCLKCHQTDQASFKTRHLNYPVEKSRCTSCHDPHGSSQGAILYDNVHQPIVNKMCNQCHNEAQSAEPLGLKKNGFELCQGCHYEMMNKTLNKKRMHWPLLDKTGCINCHSPHASPVSGLLKKPMLPLCGSCHADTISRQERSQTPHPPVADGDCTACHSPHASDNLFFMNEASTVTVCGNCHDWQTHSTHPIGEKVLDPRNQNITLQCMSCHRTHGTEYKHFMYFPDTQTLCVQCHEKYRR